MPSIISRDADKAAREQTLRPTEESLPVKERRASQPQATIDEEPRLERDESRHPQRPTGNLRRTLVFWVLIAFLLRLLAALCFEQVISPDGIEYVALARNIAAGQFRAGLSTYWPPLYPLLVALSSLFFHDTEFAGRFVSIVAGSLLVIPSYHFIRHWYGERAALLGAALISLHPVLISYSTVLLTESTYTLFFTCGVLAGWSALSSEKSRASLLAGATFGACYLLKPEAAFFVLPLVAAMLGRKLFERAASLKRAVRNAVLICAGFLLVAAPYLFYLRQQTGAWTLSVKTLGHLWQGSRMEDAEYLAPTVRPLAPEPTIALVQLTKALRLEYEIFNLIFPPPFVLLVGLGLFRRRWQSKRVWRELYLFSFAAAALAGYAVTLPNIRFLVPLLPLLLCWLSQGIVEFAGWAGETLEKARAARSVLPLLRNIGVPLLVAGLLASLIPLTVYLLRGDKWGDYYGQKRATVWITEHDAKPSPVIMSTVPIPAFYARGRHVRALDEDYSKLIARARNEGVDYLIVNERDFKRMGLRSLLDERSSHPGLVLAHSLMIAPEHKILVYAVERNEQDLPPQPETP